jgi:hypothetical protein
VLPDLRDQAILPLDPAKRAAAIRRRADQFEMDVQEFMHTKVDDAKGRKLKAKIELEDSTNRLANQHIAQAEDATLVDLFRVGYAYFTPQRFPDKLKAFEERYFVDKPLYPGGPVGRRACIWNALESKQRFEMMHQYVNGRRVNPALHKSIDSGSIGFPHALWLFSKQKVRGTLNIDHTHRLVRDQADTIGDSGLRLVKARAGAVCNFAVGPWDKQAYFHVIRDAALEMFELFDEHWIVFRLQYQAICRAAGDPVHIIGTPEHMRLKWQSLKHCMAFIKMGMKSVFGHWFSLENKSEEIFEHLPVLQLVLIYHGMRQKWWDSVLKSPLAMPKFYHSRVDIQAEVDRLRVAEGDIDDDEDVAIAVADLPQPDVISGAAGAAADGHVKMTVEMSRAELLKMKKSGSCKHALSFISMSIADTRFMRLWQGMVHIQSTFKAQSGQDQVKCQTKAGTKEFAMFYNRGDVILLADKTMESIFEPDFLYKLNFSDWADTDALAQDIQEEIYILERLWTFSSHFTFARFLSCMEYRIFPKLFILLLGDEEEQREVLASLQIWWTWFNMMDRLSLVDRRARDWWNFIVQAHWVFTREVFVQLDEIQFELPLPECLLEDITNYAYSQRGTVIDENGMRILANRARHHPSKQISRTSRYHALLTSDLLTENGMRPLEITQAARSIAPATLDPGIFTAKDREFSLGLENLQTLAEGTASWKTMSPLNYRSIGLAWYAFGQVNGEFDQTKTAWLSMLARPKTLIYKKGTLSSETCGLVWGVTRDCLVAWKVSIEHVPDKSFMWITRERPSDDSVPVRIHVINANEKLSDWRVTPVRLMPPQVVRQRSKGRAPCGAALCCDGNTGKSMIEDAAEHAFANLNFQHLKDLIRIEKVPVDEDNPPVDENDVCRILVKHYRPLLSDDEVQVIISKRGKDLKPEKEQECSGELLDDGIQELMQGVFNGTDVVEEAQAIKKDLLHKIQANEAIDKPPVKIFAAGAPVVFPKASAAAASSGSASSSAAGPAALPVAPAALLAIPTISLEPAAAKMYLPAAAVTLHKEKKWHTRWYSKYTSADTVVLIQTKCYGTGTGLTDNEAMRWVLSAIWAAHTAETTIVCPYDFNF